MALGDFLDVKPTLKQSLKTDLQLIEARLVALEAAQADARGFHFVSADPQATLGQDGDAALHTGTGDIWRKTSGAWANTSFCVWKSP